MAWEHSGGWLQSWTPASMWETPKKLCLLIGLALANVAIWGLDKRMEDLSLTIFLSITLPFKKKRINIYFLRVSTQAISDEDYI